jgi:hypothetical protein
MRSALSRSNYRLCAKVSVPVVNMRRCNHWRACVRCSSGGARKPECEQGKERLENSLSAEGGKEVWNSGLMAKPGDADNAEGNTEAKDPRGHRWDDAMRDLILTAQIVPKTVWNGYCVGWVVSDSLLGPQ